MAINGYLTSFDGTTLINHTTLCATSTAVVTSVPHVLVYRLPNGAKSTYDGTADAAIIPGQATQDFFATSGGETLFNTLQGKKGNYATNLTLTGLAGGSQTATAFLFTVEDTTPRLHGPTGNTTMNLRVTFELVTNFT